MNEWTKAKLQSLIDNKVEESLQLEYKRAGALGKQNNQRLEITKDVSAMANSAGGTIIYGIAESGDADQRHLPGHLDPVSRTEISREWLEQVIQTIQPRIDGIAIHPVLDDDDQHSVYFVVDIPQSETAHQARDQRYYKRFNFVAVPMEDYEVRDTMNRLKHPKIALSFELRRYTPQDPMGIPRMVKVEDALSLRVTAINRGSVMAEFVVAKLSIPTLLLNPRDIFRKLSNPDPNNLPETIPYTLRNQQQDRGPMGNVLSDVRQERILPTLDVDIGWLDLNAQAVRSKRDYQISWTVHADNAQPQTGVVQFKQIPVVDQRRKQ